MAISRMLRLAPVLRRNFGCTDTEMAAAVGVDARGLADLAVRGQLRRHYPGVYSATVFPNTWEQQWMAELLAAGPRAAISGRAAAYLHDLQHLGVLMSRPEVEFTRPRGVHVRGAGPRARTALHLRDEDVVNRGPWRLTSVPWTLLSLAHPGSADRLERAVDAAIAQRLTTIDEVGSVARRFRCCPGMPVIREVLARHDPEVRFTRSEAERQLLRAIRRAGLPEPEVGHRVRDRRGERRELDFAYPVAGIMIEVDVHPIHGRTVGRRDDGQRQNDLVGDWTPLRFDEVDLRFGMPDVIATIRHHLARQSPDV